MESGFECEPSFCRSLFFSGLTPDGADFACATIKVFDRILSALRNEVPNNDPSPVVGNCLATVGER